MRARFEEQRLHSFDVHGVFCMMSGARTWRVAREIVKAWDDASLTLSNIVGLHGCTPKNACNASARTVSIGWSAVYLYVVCSPSLYLITISLTELISTAVALMCRRAWRIPAVRSRLS